MAQNTAEDTNPSVDKTETLETTTCAVNKAVSCDEKKRNEVTDIDKRAESTSEEIPKKVDNIDSLGSKERSNIRQIDCNGDPQEETNLAKEVSSERINKVKTKEDKLEESCSAEVKPSETEDNTIICEEEERLNEILKVVHGDLDIKYFQKPANQSAIARDEIEDGSEKEQQMVKTAAAPKKDATENTKERIVSATIQNSAEKKEEREESSEKMEERSEVGIVGPPTAVSELINEEELGGDSALSTDPKDHVAEWVENSVKVDPNANAEEEDNIAGKDKQYKQKDAAYAREKPKKPNNAQSVPKSNRKNRKSQRIVSNIIKKSIKCLNKMHAMEGAGGSGRNVDAAEEVPRKDVSPRASPNIPQSQQNGAALPEETAASSMAVDCVRPTTTTTTTTSTTTTTTTEKKSHRNTATGSSKGSMARGAVKIESSGIDNRKRRYINNQASTNGPSTSKKICLVGHLEDREQYISSLIACDNETPEGFAAKAHELRSEIQALDELARAKEIEWNQILQTRKLKEEAYLRVERKRQVSHFMNCSSLPEDLPSARLALGPTWESSSGDTTSISSEKSSGSKEYLSEIGSQEQLPKKNKGGKATVQRQTPPKNSGGNCKQNETLSPENRQISEGRQGVKVDVQAIIEDYRSRHPETVPRRGRRLRNPLNVGPTVSSGVIEGGHNVESRPSSTDSCKNNLNVTDCTNPMSFKDVLVHFAKLTQQQGEPVKTPQNYPDVTLHPVPPSSVSQSNAPQQTGSLLHGILTKAQSPKPTAFSPTLAKLLTAPEKSSPTTAATVTASVPQQSAQQLLQAYQGSNLGAINELLSSTKARSEITITPVVNPPASQSHSNNVIHVEDVEEETSMIDDREGKYSVGVRDGREERDNPPRCQGCKERTAQFVCAGCGNQWYCSRDCQVDAWDEHSEVCSG